MTWNSVCDVLRVQLGLLCFFCENKLTPICYTTQHLFNHLIDYDFFFLKPGSATGHMAANDDTLLLDTVSLQHNKSGDSGFLVRQIWTCSIFICGVFKG